MLRAGLTGGIACGKSRVLGRLATAGFHTLDLDTIAHEVMAPGGSAHSDVMDAFGPPILAPDGTVDRKALGALVFADAGARAHLNAIVHPRVREAEARRASAFAADPAAVVVTDAALLVETGVHLRFDRLIVVHCEAAEQLRRLMERDGIDFGAAQARIASQMPLAEKRRFAHFEVGTTGRLEETDRAADRLAAELRDLARPGTSRVKVPLSRSLSCFLNGPAHGPRGLDPVPLLIEIVDARGLEMERVARLLVPAPEGPWYRAARPDEAGPRPETLAAPLVVWCLVRGAPDPDFLLVAAASLARLTHVDPSAIAGACLFARVLFEVAVTGRVPDDLIARLPAWSSIAERWGGAPADKALAPVFEAALRYPRDPAAARQACLEGGGDPGLAGALVGMAVGLPVTPASEDLVGLLRQLEEVAGPG